MLKKPNDYYKIYKESPSDKKRLIEIVLLSIIILFIFLIKISVNGYWLWGGSLAFAETGQFGDFIGGVIGTIFSGAGFYFLYITLVEQRKAITSQKESFEKERFEAKFFDLIRLHKENVNEMKYNKIKNTNDNALEGRKIFNVIYLEFRDCLKEVKRFCKVYDNDDYVKDKYSMYLQKIISKNNIKKVTINELAMIDIAFSIIYFGVGKEGEILLRNSFIYKYNDNFFYQLLKFIQLKPNLGYKKSYRTWAKFNSYDLKELRESFKVIGKNKKTKGFSFLVDDVNIMTNYNLTKFYGGHQHRLGHYFRHLFQTYKFLSIQDNLTEEEKYFYGKTLRAQLSNYEQSILFINSISSFGFNWELNPEKDLKNNELNLITKYQLIKNITGKRILDVSYKNFYKNIKFEFESKNYE